MRRLALVARLKEGTGARAAELLAQGPPFDLADAGFERHAVYVSSEEVVFVFEGEAVEWAVDDLVSTPFQGALTAAFDAWREVVEGEPRLARPAFAWQRPG